MCTQTDMVSDDITALQSEIDELKSTLADKKKLKRDLFMETVLESDSSVRKYTGINTLMLLTGIFNVIKNVDSKIKYWRGPESADEKYYQCTRESSKPGPSRVLSLWEEYIMTLVRLRVGLPTNVISDLFGISETTVSRTFTTIINHLYSILKNVISWPSKKKIQKTMPRSFKKKYPKTRVIIDCTEFFINKPRGPQAQSATYSTYKSHNTFKALVGVSPSGAFTFVSDLWGGNVSDRYITKECGIIDKLEKGDDVMADRGFTIRDLCTAKGATLNIPPFTHKVSWGKGKRLNAAQVKTTKAIASLRIHVERAIERLKNWKLLSQTMPVNLTPLANQMVVVAAALCNFLPPLVKK